MYAEEWLGHTLLRCSTSFEKGIEYERKRNLDILQGLIKFNEQQPGELRQVVVKTLEQVIPYVMGEEMSKELRDNYDLGILAGVAQERERIIKLIQPFIEKALMHEVSVNDARGLLWAIKPVD